MTNPDNGTNLLHPLAGSSLRHFVRLLWANRSRIESRYARRLVKATGVVAAATPLRLWESLRFGTAIRNQELSDPPVFIVGHWRSGTTNLHRLMLSNSQLASVTLLHCAAPHLFLTCGDGISRYLRKRLPSNRPMDAVSLGTDEPMSEDFGLIGVTNKTHYGSYLFPQTAEAEFARTILFEPNDAKAKVAEWERDYLWLLKKITLASSGRRLCLKNPANTGRVPQLLKLFPDAKFVFVKRNPYVVHASTCRLMERFLERFALQSSDRDDIERFVSERYERLMQKWVADRDLIPSENLLELRHEDIVRDPEASVASVHRQLDICGLDDAYPLLQDRISSQAAYENNRYDFEPNYVDRISPFLAPTAQRWGYDAPTTPVANRVA